MSHVQLKIMDLIWEQERVRHEPVVIREKSLQSADDNAEDVLLCEMLL